MRACGVRENMVGTQGRKAGFTRLWVVVPLCPQLCLCQFGGTCFGVENHSPKSSQVHVQQEPTTLSKKGQTVERNLRDQEVGDSSPLPDHSFHCLRQSKQGNLGPEIVSSAGGELSMIQLSRDLRCTLRQHSTHMIPAAEPKQTTPLKRARLGR